MTTFRGFARREFSIAHDILMKYANGEVLQIYAMQAAMRRLTDQSRFVFTFCKIAYDLQGKVLLLNDLSQLFNYCLYVAIYLSV